MSCIVGAQIRAARALIGWSQSQLAAASGLSRPTIDRAERMSVSSETLFMLTTTLESAGVEFIPENGGGAGVRLRKASGGEHGVI